MTDEYELFIRQKSQLDGEFGFEPVCMPDFLFKFQKDLVAWATRKGRAAIFADCGMGKTLMELAWATNVVQHTSKPVLILTPLAVAQQFTQEAERFGINAKRSHRGEIETNIVITNYERLHYFNPNDFGGVVCDESSILKSFDGVRKREITEFMREREYRLLGTATAAPNDYTELGNSSEALGYLGARDMLSQFFTNKPHSARYGRDEKMSLAFNSQWRFKGHAEEAFWRWVSSWARALRKPSDLGYDDNGFILPPLNVVHHVVETGKPIPGMLFELPAIGWQEIRAERRRTIEERCQVVADLVNGTGEPAVCWANLNDEADLLEKLIPDAQQVSGRDDDDAKEEKFSAFSNGDLRVLITKPKIGAWGLNWQHCNHVTYFPTDSYEQWYQAVRRVWRFGQNRPVTVDVVSTPGQKRVAENMQHKEKAAAEMFTSLVAHMNEAQEIERLFTYNKPVEVPKWL